ncbi:uncharacterized protein LOC126381493 [Pectinophora gossypiella]|uniref:uncharacterized protein LOC126381493 n=1 Tax=Pectinophora gossypiella TaxID=13191 RepID=UPI00214DF8BE|nr:uncharacterized protein LOC126381493 [Pectinophora gossypiella]XP_049886936.1 uncharacterized protein LOC126381493 [Pectinophora gossypiella]
MRQLLVPVLLLAAVALSSSNVLPMTSADRLDTNAMNGQQYDNIFSNRYNTRNVLDTMFYTVPGGTSQSTRLLRKIGKYKNTNNNRAKESLNAVVNEEDNYDGEGFRKEQWHNYPRQLDRLHEYLLDYRDGDMKRSIDTDDLGMEEYDATESKEKSSSNIATNEYLLDNNEDKHNTYDAVIAATNPFLILKVHLTCLSNRLKKMPETNPEELFQTDLKKKTNDVEGRLFTNEINPAAKVKREGVTAQENELSNDNSSSKKKTVNKRLFSLWSRLQSLSHKGHELPHRRHLTFYGFPDSDGGGALTAETRAMMRPPGSPLRWG